MKNKKMTIGVAILMLSIWGCGKNNANITGENSVTEDTEKIVDITETESVEELTFNTESEVSIEETEESENIFSEDIYGEILDKYNTALLEKWDVMQLEEAGLNYLCTYYTDNTQIGYTYIDIDKDGVSELLIGEVNPQGAYVGMFFDLYTVVNNEVVLVVSSAERDRYSLGDDYRILNENSSAAILSANEVYLFDGENGRLTFQEAVIYEGGVNVENPWFYRSAEMGEEQRISISEQEALEKIDSYTCQAIQFTPFSEYVGVQSPEELKRIETKKSLKNAFESAISSETAVCFICDDFDGNGTLEGFGITGNDEGWDLKDAKVYYIDNKGIVSCIDDFLYLYGYGGKYLETSYVMDYNIINTGRTKFFSLGGNEGQKTWLYGVKGEKIYQPEISGQHDCFSKTEDGLYCAQPHEGGPGYYEYYYKFDSDTGEFVQTN